MIIMILDTETTGIFKSKIVMNYQLDLWPYIVQFSYIMYDTETHEIIKIKDSIIKVPEHVVISEENASIHGITKEISLKKGTMLSDYLLEFAKDYKQTELVIGHNLLFDINAITAELMRIMNNPLTAVENLVDYSRILNSITKPQKNKHYCTMQKTVEFCGIKKLNKKGEEFVKFPTLAELHEKLFSIIPKNLHNSLNDVLVCLRCYYMVEYKTDLLESSNDVKHLYTSLGL